MKKIFALLCLFVIIISCQDNQQQKKTEAISQGKDSVANEKLPTKEKTELKIVDTGQTWFRVHITKNDTLFMDYEGSWPLLLESNNSATLQLSKSRDIMGITDILTIYMNGLPHGKVPVVLSNREKETVSMIMSPITDGAYGLPISPTEGFFSITKNINSVVSGIFEAKAVDLNEDVYEFNGYFLNAKINPTKI